MSYLIALVEDEDNLRQNYTHFLSSQGYEVHSFSDRKSALSQMCDNIESYDLAILDIMLNEEREGGFLLCQELRNLSKNLPVIFLTALDSEYDQISGFRLGGVDYLTKDISLPLLGVRIANLLRIISDFRGSAPTPTQPIPEELKVDQKNWRISWKEKIVNLTMTEFSIVIQLIENAGQVRTFDELMEHTRQKVVNENTVSTHIRRIRRKFQDIDPHFDKIHSVHGLGYIWGEAS